MRRGVTRKAEKSFTVDKWGRNEKYYSSTKAVVKISGRSPHTNCTNGSQVKGALDTLVERRGV